MSRDALVVGINTYTHLRKLTAPAADAEAIAQILHTQGNFRVWRMPEILPDNVPQVGQKTPVSIKQLKDALAKLFNPKGQQIPDTALFYFSGHGILDDTGFEEGYLATSEANPQQGVLGLSLEWLRKLLEKSPIRQQIIFLDCCHSGALVSLGEANPGINNGKSRCFIAACRDGEVAYEGIGSEHSELTQALLRGLDARQHNGRVTSIDLTNYVTKALEGVIQAPVFNCVGEPILLTSGMAEPVEEVRRRSPSWVPRQIPPLPGYFVERPEHQDPLKEKLLCSDSRVKGTLVVSAIYGLGGIGKSVLAAKLAHDEEVQAHFSDGILWVTLGQNPDILPLLGGWIQELQDRDYQPITVESTSNHLRTLLYDKKMLLVVDDVWNPEHLEPFRVGGSECRVLVTTREAKISDAQRYDLDVMTPEQAMELLTQKFPGTLSDQAQQQVREFAERVGYLPLALELAAAQVEEGVTWAELLEDFGEEVVRLESLDYQDSGAVPEDTKRRKYSLLACFNLSLRLLSPEQLRQFAWLGVLPEDVSVGQEMAATLWEVTPRQAGATLRLFRGKALMSPGAVEGSERPTYRMHDLMHDLAKRLLCQPVEPVLESDLPGMGLTVLEAHRILLERYRTKTQDGLWHTLPDDGYIFAQLTWHMEQAGWFDAVHQLLQEETPKGRNGWFEACDVLGKPFFFVSDVGRAWRLAIVKADEELSEAVVLLWRYALVRASLNSLARNIPPGLIALLVEKGVWQPVQGWAYVKQSQNPMQQAEGIVKLAPHLPLSLYPEALVVTRQLPDESDRASALSALASYLPELWDEALAVTNQVENEYVRASVLHTFASRLPKTLLGRTLEVICQIQDEPSRADALCALVPYLPETLLSKALAIVCQIQSESDRASVLIALAPHLSKSLLGGVLTVTRHIQSESDRASVLIALAPHFPELWDEALVVTRQIRYELFRANTLCALASQFPELWDEALAVARQIQYESDRARVLCALASQFPELWDEVLAAAHQIQYESDRATAITCLAPYIPQNLLGEALILVCQIQNEIFRAQALCVLAPRLPETLLSKALEVARQIQSKTSRASALCALVPHLPELWSEVLAEVYQIQDDYPRASILRALVSHLPESLLNEVLAVTRRIQDERSRASVLCTLAPQFPELWDEALVVARQIQGDYPRACVLHTLIPHFPELWDEVLAVAYQIQDERFRISMLCALAPQFPELWDEVLAVVCQIQDEHSRASVLSALAPRLPETLLSEVLAVVCQIQDEHSRASVLSALAPRLPEALLDEALAVTRQIQDEHSRISVLSALAPYLPGLWDEVLKLIHQTRPNFLLYSLALQSPEICDKVLAMMHETQPDSEFTQKLYILAGRMPQALLRDVLALACQLKSELSQAHVLRIVSARLSEDLLGAALTMACQIQSETARVTALCSLTPYCPLSLLSKVRDLMFEFRNPYLAAEVISSFLQQLNLLGQGFSFWSQIINLLAHRERKELQSYLPKLREFIITLSGENTLRQMVKAMNDVCRQWP